MTNGFHNTIYLHGPHAPTVSWVERPGEGDPGFASINTSGASLLVCTVAEADELIKAAVLAKDLLLGPQGCDETCPDTPAHRALTQAAAAPLPPGHGENHIDNAGHATLACDGTCDPRCVNCAPVAATP